MSLGVRVCVCVRRAATVCHTSLGGEGNAPYPVLSSFIYAASYPELEIIIIIIIILVKP